MKTIGVIGTGNMGGAILQGWKDIEDIKLCAYDIDREKLDKIASCLKIEKKENIAELINSSQYILLAVKPKQVKELLKEHSSYLTPSHVILSICAGIKIKKIKKWAEKVSEVVRIMPNTPALVGRGMFAISVDQEVADTTKKEVKKLFEALGSVFEMEEEYMDAYTALIGSGPAYIIYFLEALIEAGVSIGFPRDVSTSMVKELVSGTVKMINEMPKNLYELREMVTSPGGTTIAALNHLDRQAVRGSIIDAVNKAWQRSKELG